MLHSANWDSSIPLEGKRVGVIGGGSSAVQIVPNIQPSMFQLIAAPQLPNRRLTLGQLWEI